MIDAVGREVNNLRISVTDRCNLNCFYCHHEGNLSGTEMTTQQILHILREARKAGFKTIKFTGGEPLLRDDIIELVKFAGERFSDVGITTNGTLLSLHAKALKNAGLTRVNIGCDSVATMPKNWQNLSSTIELCQAIGFRVKINTVVTRLNEEEISVLVKFCQHKGVNLQLIELIEGDAYAGNYVSLEKLEKKVREKAVKKHIRKQQNRPVYLLGGIHLEFVRPAHEFCLGCNKMRVTSNGKVRPCLRKEEGIVHFKDADSFQGAVEGRDFYGYD